MSAENAMSKRLAGILSLPLCHVASSQHPLINISKVPDENWEIVWVSGEPKDPNYFFVAENKSRGLYALIIRGSVICKGVFTQWDVFVDWILEDMNAELVYWPFYDKAKHTLGDELPCIGAGAYIAFTTMMKAKNKLPEGHNQLLHDFLIEKTGGKDNKQLIIAGHSLGGNMAKVYSSFYREMLRAQNNSADNITLCTFAAPASGNGHFATDLNNKIDEQIHYQNTNDIVPHFPTYDGINAVSELYDPSPAASEIVVEYNQKGEPVYLKQVLKGLAISFLQADYQQPEYDFLETFSAPLINRNNSAGNDTKERFAESELNLWVDQAGAQHQMEVYARYGVGVKLPDFDPQTLECKKKVLKAL